jgi:hypothetical protein
MYNVENGNFQINGCRKSQKWSDVGINRVKGQQLYNSKYCIKVKIDNYCQTKAMLNSSHFSITRNPLSVL